MPGFLLDELSALQDLTTEQIDAVHEDAHAKSGGDGNPIGLMIRMLQDGERGEERRDRKLREQRREEAANSLEDVARDFLESLPEVKDADVLEAAKAWLEHFHVTRLYSTAKDALPQLHIKDHKGVESWYVSPADNERALVACYKHDIEHTMTGEKFASDWSAKSEHAPLDQLEHNSHRTPEAQMDSNGLNRLGPHSTASL